MVFRDRVCRENDLFLVQKVRLGRSGVPYHQTFKFQVPSSFWLWFHLLNSVLFISVWVHAIWIYMHQSALLWINKFLATDIYEFLIISYNVGRKFNISLMFPSGPPLSRICSITKKMPSWNPMMLWWFPVDRSHKALTLKRLCCDSIKA